MSRVVDRAVIGDQETESAGRGQHFADDHARAKRVARAINEFPGLTVDLETVQTNIVIIETDGSSEPWLEKLRSQGVWALPPAANRIRLVFHRDVDDAGADRAIEAFRLASA